MNGNSEKIKKDLAERLTEARERTRLLLRGVSEEDLTTQQDPIMSPLIWDYGHIGNYEEVRDARGFFEHCGYRLVGQPL